MQLRKLTTMLNGIEIVSSALPLTINLRSLPKCQNWIFVENVTGFLLIPFSLHKIARRSWLVLYTLHLLLPYPIHLCFNFETTRRCRMLTIYPPYTRSVPKTVRRGEFVGCAAIFKCYLCADGCFENLLLHRRKLRRLLVRRQLKKGCVTLLKRLLLRHNFPSVTL